MTSETPPNPSPPGHAGDGRAVVARNAFHLVLGQVATTVLAVVLSAALGRNLGAADFGRYFLFTSMATFAFVVVEWGQSQYFIREVARHPKRTSALLGTTLALRLAGSLLAAGPLAMILVGLGGHDRLLASLMVLTLTPFFLSQSYGAAFRGRERMEYDALVSVLNKVLTLGLTLAAIQAGGGLTGVVLAQGAAGLCALALAAVLGRRLGFHLRAFTFATARELLVGGTPIVAMSLAVSAQAYIDALVLARLSPEAVVGWYGAAKNIIGTLIAPANILGTASFPRLSRAAQHPEQFRTEIRAAMRPVLLLGALAGLGTYLFAEFAITTIYGRSKFAAAATLLQVFAPGLFLLFVDVLFGCVILAAGKTFHFAVAKVLNVAVSTALDFVLIPYFQAHHGNGGIGVVVSFGVSELIMFAAALMIVPRRSLGRVWMLDFGKALLAAAATLGGMSALPRASSLLGSLVEVGIAVGLFGLVAYLLKLVRADDLKLLLAIFRRAPAAALDPASEVDVEEGRDLGA